MKFIHLYEMLRGLVLKYLHLFHMRVPIRCIYRQKVPWHNEYVGFEGGKMQHLVMSPIFKIIKVTCTNQS